MKKYIKNDQGYALLIALLAFTLISIIGMTLFSSVLSTAKQTNQVGNYYRAVDLAEMGVQYSVKDMETYFVDHPITSATDTDYITNYVEQMVFQLADKLTHVMVDGEFPNRKILLQKDTVQISPVPNGHQITFDVTGQDENSEKTIGLSFTIHNDTMDDPGVDDTKWGNLFPDSPPPDWLSLSESEFLNEEFHNGNVWLESSTTLQNHHIEVNGDLVEDGGFFSNTGNTAIKICGNANFVDEVKGSEKDIGQNNFNGVMEIGNYAYFEKTFNLHNRPYLSGASTYIKGGAYVHNSVNSFTVGEDLLLDIRTESYTFNAPVYVKGDVILKNANERTIHRLFSASDSFFVGGNVKISYAGQDNFEIDDTFANAENIQTGYDFNDPTIFKPSCQINSGSTSDSVPITNIEVHY